jgi:tRNA pseudouridine55 synthase
MKERFLKGSKPQLNEGGFFNIYKEKGWTSTDILNELKKFICVKKIGHMGTLDPMASGVLVVGVNRATEIFEYFKFMDKRYIAVIMLGLKTDTDDITGTKIEERQFSHIKEEDVKSVLKKYEGEIEQIPPQFSALRVGGKRAYSLAREGVAFNLKPRRVFIRYIKLLSISLPFIKVEILCGSGTYIRALARDIGDALGTCGTLAELERTDVGLFSIRDSKKLEEIAENPFLYFIPLSPRIFPFPRHEIETEEVEKVKNGDIKFLKGRIDDGPFCITFKERILGVGHKGKGGIMFSNLIK